ncbi:LuxR C-terminal-related transcriptional regulator [Rhodococcus sp. MSC1_016]|jgi:DNA-binding CsgD family transcriptional regulator|uniref:LuxR C-terminal-related transcriptional regulator n=1 Tax=Rhodococcus sp. MSC1_016 TaxID=2909266 RepID=UPI00202F2B1D|nr:LuxR C-terminal-related transcriptional regulator [Rhodococcus sp. MSC1_016]
MVLTWPSIPRGPEISALARDSTRGIVIVGAVGVGKTSLAQKIVCERDCEAVWVVGADSLRGVPLGAFASVVNIGAAPDPDTALTSAVIALRGCTATLVVDDADRLDPLSTTLLRCLIDDGSVRLVVTLGGRESRPSTALLPDAVLHRVELDAFTCDEAVRVIETALGGPMDDVGAQWLWNMSEGNPLYLRHLVEGSWKSGLFERSDGVWRLRSRPVVSTVLASLLGSRLRNVPPDVLDALQLVALEEGIHVDVLQRATSPDAVAAAHCSGLLRFRSEGLGCAATLSHPILGEVLREQTGVLAARVLRGRIVRAHLASDSPGDTLRLATLALDSDAEIDVARTVEAAESALDLCEYALAERLAQAALSRGGGIRAAMVAARAMTWQGRVNDADTLLAAVDPAEMSEAESLTWGMWRATALFFADREAAAREKLADMRARVTDRHGRDVVTSVELTFDFFAKDVPRSLELTRDLFGPGEGTPPALALAASIGGAALARAGSTDQVRGVITRGAEAAKEVGFMLGHMQIGVAEVFAATVSGQLDTLDSVLERYVPTHQGRANWVVDMYIRGLAHLAVGRAADAEDQFRRGRAAALDGGPPIWLTLSVIGLCQALGMQERTDDATEALAAAESSFGAHMASFEPDLLLARAWMLAARGEHREAIAAARKAARRAHAGSMFGVETVALHTSVRFGDRSATGRLRALTHSVDGPLVRVAAAQAHSFGMRDGHGLDRVATEFERMHAYLLAADAAAQAAIVHRRHGDDASRQLSTAAARRLAGLCPGAKTPALRALDSPSWLTPREVGIAALVVIGMTNREIAQRLTLSVRTVEGHVYRMSTKLGVDNRKSLVNRLMIGPDA